MQYSPKTVSEQASASLAEQALHEQAVHLAARVGEPLASAWAAGLAQRAKTAQVSNLLTISLDDAQGVYRGAGHRQAAEQHLVIGPDEASPGFVRGPLPAGIWYLTVSVHTLVSAQCGLAIQIGAEMASIPR